MAIDGVSGARTNTGLILNQVAADVASDRGSDLTELTGAAQAYALYKQPQQLRAAVSWDGSLLTGSERERAAEIAEAAAQKAAKADAAAAEKKRWARDPFDQSTWDVKSTKDPAAAKETTGTVTGTGKVIPAPKYSFDPFDQSTWWKTKGSTVDVKS